METWLFNVTEQLKAVRDAIVTKGPLTLRAGADILAKLESAMRNAAGYIELVSPMVQFSVHGAKDFPAEHVASPAAAGYVGELQAMKAEFEAELAAAEKDVEPYHATLQKAQEHKIQAGIMDWVSKINPETRKFILGVAIQIINGVLTKTGIPITLPGASTKGGKETASEKKAK